MTTTTAYPAAMAELKGESTHSSMWNGYGSTMPLSRFPGGLDSTAQHQHSRPRTGVDHPYPYGRYGQEETEAFERTQPAPAPHHNFPSLKRTYSESQQPPYTEIVQDLREDSSKLGVNHDHKLLSFKRVPDKHTIVDAHGRMQQLELTAQLHGMFFLSEMPSSTPDGTILQPELTCYRRNLFQISGSLITPRGQLSVITETGETVPVGNTEVTISAIESVDGHPVRLIVIPWKTPPPNAPEMPQSPDQEPPTLPLIPFQDDGTEPQEGEYAVYPIGWRRLQFRIATANNGRRKELQQHFVLHLKVMATLANGSKAVLTESTTAPIVVRGRSPRNFQARKEIPLLGSSAGSRGQALVETGLGIVAGPLTIKPGDAKARVLNVEMPRGAFTFNASKLSGNPMTMRQNSYPAWTPPSQVPLPQMPTSATAAYPPSSMPESYPKVPLSGAPGFTTEPQEMSQLQNSMAPPVPLGADPHPPPAIRTQYAYSQSTTGPPPQISLAPAPSCANDNNLAVPRYVDNNPRPTKSPRTAGHQSVHSSGSLSNEQSEYRYGPPYGHNSSESTPAYSSSATGGPAPSESTRATTQSSNPTPTTSISGSLPPRDYLPPSNSWTTTAGEPTSTVSYTNGDTRAYSYQDYKPAPLKADTQSPTGPPIYSSSSLSHYSWTTS